MLDETAALNDSISDPIGMDRLSSPMSFISALMPSASLPMIRQTGLQRSISQQFFVLLASVSKIDNSGLFATDIATSPAKGEDMSSFSPDFNNYDVVVLDYNGDAWPEATNKAFIDYVVVWYDKGNKDYIKHPLCKIIIERE